MTSNTDKNMSDDMHVKIAKDKADSFGNCLNDDDVKILTKNGFIPIKDLTGKTVEIMTKGNGWVFTSF